MIMSINKEHINGIKTLMIIVLYECDFSHVFESSWIANESDEQTNQNNNRTSTPVALSPPSPPPKPLSSLSNDSNATLKLNLNESIDSTISQPRLYDLKHLIVEKLFDNLNQYLFYNSTLNTWYSIAY